MPGSGDSSRKRDVLPSCDEDVLRLESLCSHHCLPDDDDDDDDGDDDGDDDDGGILMSHSVVGSLVEVSDAKIVELQSDQQLSYTRCCVKRS